MQNNTRKYKKQNTKPHEIFQALSCVLFLFMFFNVLPSESSAAALSISPGSGTFSVGSTFDVQILLNTEGKSINALDIRILFPPSIFQVVSPSAGQSIVGIWTSPPRFDNQTGEIVFQGGIPEGIDTSRGLISTITFRARGTGNGSLRFSDKSKVLLHDGLGTDALRQTQSAVFNLVLPPPAGPIVASETHPNQNIWYSNSNVLLRWSSTGEAVSGYSFVLDNRPISIPDNTINSTDNFTAYQNLESGTYYFHIKALGKGGVWGGTTHFSINVDTLPPAAFPIEVRPGFRTTSKNLFLYFNTTDAHSGLDRYEYKALSLSPGFIKEVEAYQTFFVETTPPEVIELDLGKYDIFIRAYDKAGNIEESVRRVKIMTPVNFYMTSKWTFIIAILLLVILFFVFRRAYEWHKNIEKKHTKKELTEDVKNQLKELRNYRRKYGSLVLVAGFLAGSLWFAGPVHAQEGGVVVKLPPPLITTISKDISNEDIFYIGGKTESGNIDVNIFLQNLQTGETRSFLVASDTKGDWFYRHPTFLLTGEYLLWTQSSLGDLTSPPSSQARINVSQTAFQFGSNRLSFETLYLIFNILLFSLVIILGVLISVLIIRGRRKHLALIKEVKEAEEAVKRGFTVLKRDIEAELSVIHKAKLSKSLSQEEKLKEEQLLKDLSEMERYIGKEIWDIEKYA